MHKQNTDHRNIKFNSARKASPNILSKIEFFSLHVSSLDISTESSHHSPRDDPHSSINNDIHKQSTEPIHQEHLKCSKSDLSILYHQILALLLPVSSIEPLLFLSIWKQLYNLLLPFQHTVPFISTHDVAIYTKESFWRFLSTAIPNELEFLHISNNISAFNNDIVTHDPKDNTIQFFTIHQLFQTKLAFIDNDLEALLSSIHTLRIVDNIDLFRILIIRFIHDTFYMNNHNAIDHYSNLFSIWSQYSPSSLFQPSILFHLSSIIIRLLTYFHNTQDCNSISKFSSSVLNSVSSCWIHMHQWNTLPITWTSEYFTLSHSHKKSMAMSKLEYPTLKESLSIFQKRLIDDSSSWLSVIYHYHSLNVNNCITEPSFSNPIKRDILTRTAPKQLAEYLTLIEWSRFYYLSEWILIEGLSSQNQDGILPILSPKAYIQYLVDWFNRISYSICYSILSLDKMNDRVSMLKHWILTAEQCLNIGNYQTFFQIISSLSMSPLTRCQKTWSKLSKRHYSLYLSMLDISSPLERFKRYRNHLSESFATNLKTPILPFMGVFMSDSTFAMDGNVTFVQPHLDKVEIHKYNLNMHNSMDFYVDNMIDNSHSTSINQLSVSENELGASLPLRSHQSLICKHLIHWKKFTILYKLSKDFIQTIHARDDQLYTYYKQLSDGIDYSKISIPSDFEDIACYFYSNWNNCSIKDDSLYHISYLIEPINQYES